MRRYVGKTFPIFPKGQSLEPLLPKQSNAFQVVETKTTLDLCQFSRGGIQLRHFSCIYKGTAGNWEAIGLRDPW